VPRERKSKLTIDSVEDNLVGNVEMYDESKRISGGPEMAIEHSTLTDCTREPVQDPTLR
jgi:hypothetical protein